MPNKAALLLVFSLIFSAPQHPDGPRNAEIEKQIQGMKTAIVQIRYSYNVPGAPQGANDPLGKLTGTGFLVSPQGYVLTAGHVIRSVEAEARDAHASAVQFMVGLSLDPSSNAYMNFRGSFNWVRATPVDVDDIHDVGLLKLTQNPFVGEVRSKIMIGGVGMLPIKTSLVRVSSRLPLEGEDVIVSGYPLVQSAGTSQQRNQNGAS